MCVVILPVEPSPASAPHPVYSFRVISVLHPHPRHWWEIVDSRSGWVLLRSIEFDSEIETRDNARLVETLFADPAALLDGWSRHFPHRRGGPSPS